MRRIKRPKFEARRSVFMPELPEVETIVRTLRPAVIGRRITATEVRVPRATGRPAPSGGLLNISAEQFAHSVSGTRIERVERYGKHIVIHLDREPSRSRTKDERLFLLIHLGMTGRLTCETVAEFARKHTHMVLALDEPGRWLHYCDIRRFGRIRLTEKPGETLGKLGPDPLEISAEEFVSRLHSHRTMLKSLLLDQRFLRGLGNIYADESLFRAGIHPAAIAARLSRKRALGLHQAIRETLCEAIEQGGSSISDYVDATGQPGFFQISHQVYQRTGQPCLRCGGAPGSKIRRIVVAGRSTHYCARCQRKAG